MQTTPKINFENTEVAFSSKSNKALRKAYLIFATMNKNWLVNIGTSLVKVAFKLHLPVKWMVKYTIFEHFCGGESIAECDKTIAELSEFGIGTILDYSVEGEKTEKGFDATTEELLRTIEKAENNSAIPFTVFKVTGIASTDLLEKVQAGGLLSKEEEKAFAKVKERVDKICGKAASLGVKIFIDGEESWIQDPIDQLAYEMMEKYNREEVIIFNTYQMYRWASLGALENAYNTGKEKGYRVGAKLVRGAYMEKERERAEDRGYKDPIQPNKKATDEDYNKALKFCMGHIDTMELCSGSHNEYSNQLLVEMMDERGLAPGDKRVWFAQLYGMSDNISFALAKEGFNVAKYVPYGPVVSVMPYLIRRAEENTSIAGQSSREYLLVKKEMQRRKMAGAF
jgi:proline dehydrogenase